MSKPTVNLQGLLTEKVVAPEQDGPDRGRRLSVQVDSATYKRIRQFSLDHDLTHQDIIEKAIVAFLDVNG